jgi:hypothetical protein
MNSPLQRLSGPVLRGIVAALAAGRVPLPCHPMHLHDLVPDGGADAVADELNALVTSGNPAVLLTRLLAMVADEREQAQRRADAADLVWSGPEAPGSVNRDTAIVVRELFEEAQHSVLVASYAVDAGEKARAIFEPLALRLDRGESLNVHLVVNIGRAHGRREPADAIVAEWTADFRTGVWPGRVLPPVFYDPRALNVGGAVRACMHAKCVVIDERSALVTSANFTEAAHLRNIEVGVLLRDAVIARQISTEFMAQVQTGQLVRCV